MRRAQSRTSRARCSARASSSSSRLYRSGFSGFSGFGCGCWLRYHRSGISRHVRLGALFVAGARYLVYLHIAGIPPHVTFFYIFLAVGSASTLTMIIRAYVSGERPSWLAVKVCLKACRQRARRSGRRWGRGEPHVCRTPPCRGSPPCSPRWSGAVALAARRQCPSRRGASQGAGSTVSPLDRRRHTLSAWSPLRTSYR